MKRIGTMTTALGLIFYGIWMLLNQNNEVLAAEIFKWWPIIFVLLGLEILIYFAKSHEEDKVKLNFSIIAIIFLFLFTNLFYNVKDNVKQGLDFTNFSWDYNLSATNKIGSSKLIKIKEKNLNFRANNAEIEIKKSQDENVKLDLDVYVKEDSGINKYDIKSEENNNDLSINIIESYINKIKGTIYVPDGLNISIDVPNLKIECNDNLINTNLKVSSNNSKYNLSNLSSVKLEDNNSDVNINDIKNVNLKSSNGSIHLNGDVQYIDVNTKNTSVVINNKICKIVNVTANNGAVQLNTEDKNIDVKLLTDIGNIRINNEEKRRGELSKVIGTGEGKVKIKTNIGSVKVRSQE